jgi:hypothetical protein
MPPWPLYLSRKPLHLTQGQMVLGVPNNRDSPFGMGRVSSLAKDVDLFELAIPLLPDAL